MSDHDPFTRRPVVRPPGLQPPIRLTYVSGPLENEDVPGFGVGPVPFEEEQHLLPQAA